MRVMSFHLMPYADLDLAVLSPKEVQDALRVPSEKIASAIVADLESRCGFVKVDGFAVKILPVPIALHHGG